MAVAKYPVMERDPKTEVDRIEPLPVLPVASPELDALGSPGWLIDGLWAAEGVGVIGGTPKSCKTWLALDLAVSVSSGTDALGRFPVQTPGRVLVYCAEAHRDLRDRIRMIAAARGLGLSDLDLELIVADSLRLDAGRDLARLRATVEQRAPRLVVLDPLVRLHGINENSAGEMSALLGELRIVHVLAVEHRSARSPRPYTLALVEEPAKTHLRFVGGEPDEDEVPEDTADKIVVLLSAGAMSREALRGALRVRNATIGEILARLRAEGRIPARRRCLPSRARRSRSRS